MSGRCRTTIGRRRALLLWVALLCAAGLARGFVRGALTPADVRRDDHAAGPSNLSGFRLGTGAAPFGWSTAVADVDADGTPDLVIVDRVQSRTEEYAYDLDVELSTAPAQHLRVAWPVDAVRVLIEDVDHDRDLDIVITRASTPDIVAIWLNDGAGRFSPARATAVVPRATTLLASDAAAQPTDVFVESRRIAATAETATAADIIQPARRFLPDTIRRALTGSALAAGSRAPPATRSYA